MRAVVGFRAFAFALLFALSTTGAYAQTGTASGVGGSIRGFAESESTGASRTYVEAAPFASLVFPLPALRTEFRYAPHIFLSATGGASDRVLHAGFASVSNASLRRPLVLSAKDSVEAIALSVSSPIDSPENLTQTNRVLLTAGYDTLAGLRTMLHSEAALERFDTFVGVVSEIDGNKNGLADPEEDLNGNNRFDNGLRPSFSGAAVGETLSRDISPQSRAGLFAEAAVRQYDELVVDDHVRLSSGVKDRTDLYRSLALEASAAGRVYFFADGRQFEGIDGRLALALRVDRQTTVRASLSAERSLDAFGKQVVLAGGSVDARHEFTRDISLNAFAGAIATEGIGSSSASYGSATAQWVGLAGSLPLRDRLRMTGGIRLWGGSQDGVELPMNRLVYVGVSFE